MSTQAIWKLEPILTFNNGGKKSYEMILVRDDRGYPLAVMHIDSFWPNEQFRTPETKDLYDKLYSGTPLELRVEIIDKSSQDDKQ